MDRILAGKLHFSGTLSPHVKSLIGSMLRQDPDARPSIVEILNSPWVRRLQAEFRIPDRGIDAPDSAETRRGCRALVRAKSEAISNAMYCCQKLELSPNAPQLRDLLEEDDENDHDNNAHSPTVKDIDSPDAGDEGVAGTNFAV